MTASLAVATAQMPQSSQAGGQKKSSEPLVTHKLFVTKVQLSGTEVYDTFDEWYADMCDDFEIRLSGSKALMREAEAHTGEPLTTEVLLKHNTPSLALNVSKELFAVLKKKTIGQARNQLKALNDNEGLEAWRLIRANVCRKDGQRLQGEYGTLTYLARKNSQSSRTSPRCMCAGSLNSRSLQPSTQSIKLASIKRPTLFIALSQQKLRPILIEKKAHNSKPNQYSEFMAFIINLSRSAGFQKHALPKPLTANCSRGTSTDHASGTTS